VYSEYHPSFSPGDNEEAVSDFLNNVLKDPESESSSSSASSNCDDYGYVNYGDYGYSGYGNDGDFEDDFLSVGYETYQGVPLEALSESMQNHVMSL
jgi:hypothetical protein